MKTNMMTTLKIKALHRLAVMLLLKLLCFGCGLSRGVKQLLDYVLDGGLEDDTLSGSTGQCASMKAAVYLQTSDIQDAQGRVDPLALEQWYLTDTNVFAAWGTQVEQAKAQGYSGAGIKIGQFEPGGPFSTGPEEFDYRHPDLAPNADKAWLNSLDGQGNNITPQTKNYQKRSCLRKHLLGYRHKTFSKCAQNSSKSACDVEDRRHIGEKLAGLGDKCVFSPTNTCASSHEINRDLRFYAGVAHA